MGLRAVVANAIDVAFAAAGDVALAVTFTHLVGPPTRNDDTGIYVYDYRRYTCVGIWVQLKRNETRADVLASDGAMLIKRAQVPLIEAGDYVVVDGETYQVLTFDSDPTTQLATVYLRTSKVAVLLVGAGAILSGEGSPLLEGGGESIIEGGT